MAVPYASWDDVVESFEGELPEDRRPWVEVQLRRASARLTQLVPTLPERLTIPDPADPLYVDPEVPVGLVVDAVLALFRNPSGTQQQTAGPFNQSFSGVQRSHVWFDEEQVLRDLAPPVQGNPYGGTFRVGIPDYLKTARDVTYPNPMRLPLP